MTLEDIKSKFCTSQRIKAVTQAISNLTGSKSLLLTGLSGSAPAMLFAGLPKRKEPYMIVANDADEAGYIYNDLCRICTDEHVYILPSGYKRDIRFGQPDPPSVILRTEAIDAWISGRACWVVTYPEAMAEKVPQRQKMQDSTVTLKNGGTVIMGDILNRLRELGFAEVDYVYEPGQFARRGSILDIYSYSSELPYRIDFFDDEIDSIRTFDVETQLSQTKVNEVRIIPAGGQTDPNADIALTDFAGQSTIMICHSKSAVLERIKDVCASEMSESVLISGEGDEHALEHLADYPAIESGLRAMRTVEFTAAPEVSASAGYDVIPFGCIPQALYHKNFDLITASFTDYLQQGYTIYLLSDSPLQADRLRSIFTDRGDDIPFTAVDATLHEGFADPASKSCFFTDHQIFDRFHKYNLKSDKARSGKLALSIKELNQIEIGDYIVHIDHGVGRFGGLVRTDVSGKTQEMIKLIYQNDDIIFVSIHSLHKLAKYRGKEGVPPKINKLGSGAWNRVKERTKAKMKDIARDLIKLYAARRDEKGFAFSPDSYLQHELEAGFIYEETPDQLKAVEAVKEDMESARPMDRLVCGDVGFGKTEVAIRAAFKAAADSKQTAVLVPTTVLAMQHYQTFSQRLKDLPVRVDFLSRARKPKEVKQILADLEAGKIDIIIGTHKLVGKQVKFHDLGLLVIDEEQKFGVAVKEKLKQLRVNVDTLTMSATPIPRTLQFSLMGARDLSSINTPPSNRHPIVTTVATFADDIVAEALNFEISRGGQVFFVTNRIEHLDSLENTIRRLVPDARVVKAHGRMAPEALEKAIVDFAAHDYDILLSTTIIESGIDMPNVNTIIVNNAQNFGLSELHQLRGRVGRSPRKAFCYLLTPPGTPLTPVARRRLQAIESFSDLGAGIHIAMQDLDIRGAGNLLGAEQSGFIADLGYETYQKILKESVLELKNEEFADEFADEISHDTEYVTDCVIETDMELLIPASYVPQEGERIALYQALDNMTDSSQTDTFRENMRDRFGPIPAETEELIRIVQLRAIAKQLGFERVNLKQGRMYMYLVPTTNEAYYKNSDAFGRVLQYMQLNPRRTQLRQQNGKNSVMIYKVGTVSDALDILTTIRTLPPA